MFRHFIDEANLKVQAGDGGDGVIAWRREKFIPKGGPAGGDGGNGGSVFIQADPQVFSLQHFRHRKFIQAKSGMPGAGATKAGKRGEDIILKVPCGTLVKSGTTGETLFDLKEPYEKKLLCKGGKGGRGNFHFRSPTNQAPNIREEGEKGEELDLFLELKLIADVGLVGMPNAGKSSLMNRMTFTNVKIGAYPFTTLFPSLGYMQLSQNKLLIADIPGIIQDAHLNKGLGLEFLRHIERSFLLLFVLDAAGTEGRTPAQDFALLKEELSRHNPELLHKPYLVVLNKTDQEEASLLIEDFCKNYPDVEYCALSALKGEGMDTLTHSLEKRLHSSLLEGKITKE